MFFSTRNKEIKETSSKALIDSISKDGGLFIKDDFKKLDIKEMLNLSYEELALSILSTIFDDLDEGTLKEAISKAYSKNNFPDKITDVSVFNNFSFLELFHGPTLTFKDMALSLLPHLLDIATKKENFNKKIMILTATSGDTGSATLQAFSNKNNIHVSVLYPDNGISNIQERQMLYYSSPTSQAYAITNANFDDCQTMAKHILNKENDKYFLSSANSINVGRLFPQIVYYFKGYFDLVRSNKIKMYDEIDVVVPTGNFGNILSSYIAKQMGLPIKNIACASNENRVLTDFFETGIYDSNREFIKTNSPSMDILISSNLERLLYLLSRSNDEVAKYMSNLKMHGKFEVSDEIKVKLKEFKAESVSQKETLELINQCFNENNYLIDPHTAVAYGVYKKLNLQNYTMIVATASPYKFPETILDAFNCKCGCVGFDAIRKVEEITNTKMPKQLKKLEDSNIPKYCLALSEIEKKIFS